MKKAVLLAVIAIVFIAGAAALLIFSQERNLVEENRQKSDGAYSGPKLQLPFSVSDISSERGGVNPLGVVRFNADRADLGHSGIDIPLYEHAPLVAVADGVIVEIKEAGDEWGGRGITHLLEKKNDGEGWVYIYEHVTPRAGLEVGDSIKAGEKIATKTAPEGFTAHFQMAYAFNSYKFYREMTCWIDHLQQADQETALRWWNERIASGIVSENWTGIIHEGGAPFEGLLDPVKFPKGPQLCYPLGTDVR